MAEKKTFGSINIGKTEDIDFPVFYLEHSCDEWVIGNLQEAERFLKELQEAIEFYKKQLEAGANTISTRRVD